MSTTVTKRVSATASGGNTARVSAIPSGGKTQRLSQNPAFDELALEGDQAPGTLLLEGDMASGIDHNLLLEGDQQTGSTTLTRRVTL